MIHSSTRSQTVGAKSKLSLADFENESTNQLLYVNQVKLVTQSDRVELDQFLVPMFAVIFAIIVILQSLNKSSEMPLPYHVAVMVRSEA